MQLDAVLSFTVDADVVVERMLARGRADDNEDVIRNRLSVYATETAPLLEHYGLEVTSIDAVGEVQSAPPAFSPRSASTPTRPASSRYLHGPVRSSGVVPFRSAGELDAMAAAGAVVGAALVAVREATAGSFHPGVGRRRRSGDPRRGSSALVQGATTGFPGSICSSVNDVVVHGIPSAEVVIADGDPCRSTAVRS